MTKYKIESLIVKGNIMWVAWEKESFFNSWYYLIDTLGFTEKECIGNLRNYLRLNTEIRTREITHDEIFGRK